MSRGQDPEPFSETLGEMFKKLGLPDPGLMSEIVRAWDEWAGSPWAGRSRPVLVRGKTLVVEASSPSMVAFLRYGEVALLEALKERLGTGIIESIEVKPPGRS